MPTPGERWESYFYPQEETSGPIRTLRNNFDEHNAVVLDLLEKSATALRVRQLNSGQVRIPHTFNAAHVKAIHAHLFQDVYDWAGEFRNVDISKKGQAFADHDGGGIESYLRYATRTIQEQDWKGLDRESCPGLGDSLRLCEHCPSVPGGQPARHQVVPARHGRVVRVPVRLRPDLQRALERDGAPDNARPRRESSPTESGLRGVPKVGPATRHAELPATAMTPRRSGSWTWSG